ncbi:arginine-tRNA-protein transferase 1 [Aureobasidium namibiae CBS 147.97]|uniref:Arginyl-tRNA--protein transferase 1 n=1 Tax=Aureobasidium namibiae CBS 147.97 TaxID=1043004 RepID=A0A074X9B9_9PEZI|nr:arginine-tRNA-protein transferase 1 [Aureobasidium namibiae CBS 147.97]KEQ71216.1 arginine-tRNA-protein transferase 1 [Aureobasidium namibiae CBS 147.97]
MPAPATLLTPIGGSYYVITKSLSAKVYQDLIDRGWRRSGNLIYKPDVYRSCCPHYTIRLPAKSLAANTNQRKALNSWNKLVLGEEYIKETTKRFPKTKEEKARQRNGFDLLHTVHEAEIDQLKPVAPAHRFEVTLEPDTCTEEKFQLYKDYQIHVHHDEPEEVSKKGFERFLCKSPIARETVKKDGKEQRLGSYHQCYRLDGRLIAIGVLDLLPHAVSGVYFIYHQDFEKWSFGKLSAMREAALALEGGYEFYYMGYYIHSCVKMRYKGDYKPQYVLDPETYEWNPLEGEVRELMAQQKYVSLSRERSHKKGEEGIPYLLDTPVEVAANPEDLFQWNMPGMMSAADVEAQVDLDKMRIHISKGMTVHTEDLVAWESGDIEDANSIKGVVGRYAAMVGPEVAKVAILDFSGH